MTAWKEKLRSRSAHKNARLCGPATTQALYHNVFGLLPQAYLIDKPIALDQLLPTKHRLVAPILVRATDVVASRAVYFRSRRATATPLPVVDRIGTALPSNRWNSRRTSAVVARLDTGRSRSRRAPTSSIT
jgi:hypothetical protein